MSVDRSRIDHDADQSVLHGEEIDRYFNDRVQLMMDGVKLGMMNLPSYVDHIVQSITEPAAVQYAGLVVAPYAAKFFGARVPLMKPEPTITWKNPVLLPVAPTPGTV